MLINVSDSKNWFVKWMKNTPSHLTGNSGVILFTENSVVKKDSKGYNGIKYNFYLTQALYEGVIL